MTIPRPAPLSEDLKELRRAALPSATYVRLDRIIAVAPKLRDGAMPIRAIAGTELLTEQSVMLYLMRRMMWVRPTKAEKLYAIGNISSWLLARDRLPLDCEVPVLMFGTTSNWFKNLLDFERVVEPLISATPRDELDLLVDALAGIVPTPLLRTERVNPSIVGRLTGQSRDTVSKRLKRS